MSPTLNKEELLSLKDMLSESIALGAIRSSIFERENDAQMSGEKIKSAISNVVQAGPNLTGAKSLYGGSSSTSKLSNLPGSVGASSGLSHARSRGIGIGVLQTSASESSLPAASLIETSLSAAFRTSSKSSSTSVSASAPASAQGYLGGSANSAASLSVASLVPSTPAESMHRSESDMQLIRESSMLRKPPT